MSGILTLGERAALEREEKRKSKYVGDRPLPIVDSGAWPESLAGGQFAVINEMYDNCYDVNEDGELGIADINALIDLILWE